MKTLTACSRYDAQRIDRQRTGWAVCFQIVDFCYLDIRLLKDIILITQLEVYNATDKNGAFCVEVPFG